MFMVVMIFAQRAQTHNLRRHNNRLRRGLALTLNPFRFNEGNPRDIVLAPERETATEVQAVYEEQDENNLFNEMLPTRTLEVQIDNVEGVSTGQEQHRV